MANTGMDITRLKQQAATRAISYVEPGMVVGLGHGSTAMLAVRHLAERLHTGQIRDIACIPCSAHVEAGARQLGIPVTTLEAHPFIDLTIDGADEVDRNLDLIKGAGGALLREKIVAQASRREVIIVDETKLSPSLGTRCAVPVEVVPFGWHCQADYLESLGAHVRVRQNEDGTPFKTDQGNLILDCHFGPIPAPAQLAARLKERTGIVEHGLFVGLALEVIAASTQGIQLLKRDSTHSSKIGKTLNRH